MYETETALWGALRGDRRDLLTKLEQTIPVGTPHWDELSVDQIVMIHNFDDLPGDLISMLIMAWEENGFSVDGYNWYLARMIKDNYFRPPISPKHLWSVMTRVARALKLMEIKQKTEQEFVLNRPAEVEIEQVARINDFDLLPDRIKWCLRESFRNGEFDLNNLPEQPRL